MGHPDLEPLRRRLEEEEEAYADALRALDRLAAVSVPEAPAPAVPDDLAQLNALWPAPARPVASGLGGALRTQAWNALAPVVERQERFNAALVRLLNAHLERSAGLHAGVRELAGAFVRYAQRVEPVMDARDQARVATAPTEAHVLLDAFARRLEAMRERIEGLLALRDRLEAVSEEVRAVRGSLDAAAPPPELARAAARSAVDSAYTAFENRFRGSREEIRARQRDDVALFAGLTPVVDLGCGRGEFLELLREAGIEGRGVEGNANVVRECRAKGLDVVAGDLVEFLRTQATSSLAGIFAAQVVEHLPPAVLVALLAEAHRALRSGGLLVLETVNAASALAFHEVFVRDLSHERPLHPETLRFMVAAAGFGEARIEMRSPVSDDVRLALLPSGVLPPPATKVLNENAERLNALLYAPLDYALVARR
ncbi:MAG TPA: methionine biosynthesis protein MetW [Vicinamibacteria bacterium]|nr:methionine biosynthesis protein MetW [Vicinamibacteria bacterium]